ncbi:MAG: MFS transporter [Saprospiraceae bacterium]|nr:MAG: MFS transporter [Saprospiraceae bacterium]
MNKEKLLLLILAAIQFTHIVDFMIIMPLGAQLMTLFDITPRQFSWIVAVYALSAFVAGLVSTMFIDRLDRKKAILMAYIGFTVGTLACSVAYSFEIFLVARSVAGAFGGILGALVLAVVGDVIPYERRSSAMGWVMTAFSVASVIGVPAGIYLAAKFSWQMPFLVIGGIALLFTGIIFFVFPSLTGHLESKTDRPSPWQTIRQIFSNSNQTGALLFSVILMLGHFSIIPFIAPYMQLNIGFDDFQVAYIYTIGGILTVFFLPYFGRLSDRFGNALVFSIASFFALFSIFAITNLPPVSLIIALCATSSFFVVASGRNVPAMTMVTSVVHPRNRGSFMSMRASVNEMALALGSFMAGMIVTENPDGTLANYQYVGYIAIVMSILAVLVAWRLRPVG